MKTILLSFKPEYFAPLRLGIKKFEYRNRFADEEVKAYIYLSSPEKKVAAIVYLSRRRLLEDMKSQFRAFPETLARIDEYMTVYEKKYAIPVYSVKEIEPISLEAIREAIPGFMPPQSYAVVRGSTALKELLDRARPVGKPIEIDHDHVRPEDICVN